MANEIVFFLTGILIGSFLNAVIYRIPRAISLAEPVRSFCPKCRTSLSWWENIPLLSFFILGRCCRHCGGKISWQYPAVELSSGVLAGLIYQSFNISVETGLYLMLFWGLLAASWIDARHGIIPNKILLFLMIFGILYSLLFRLPHLPGAALGLLIGSGLLLLVERSWFWLSGRPGMGVGDIKLAGVLGFYLGWDGFLVTLLLASILGIAWAVIAKVVVQTANDPQIPFAPFLSSGAFIFVFAGMRIDWLM